MLFVCYPKCTTCQKAKAWLEARGLPAEVRDIKTQNPTEAELRRWHALSGLSLPLTGVSTIGGSTPAGITLRFPAGGFLCLAECPCQ